MGDSAAAPAHVQRGKRGRGCSSCDRDDDNHRDTVHDAAAAIIGKGPFRVIDGSFGEGGGQILRTSLACAAITGTPLRIINIRAGRPNPGLGRQHLAAVVATAAVCGAEVTGAVLGSAELTFIPPAVARWPGGDFAFDIGSAGSVTLVLQAVLPLALLADGPSVIRVTGGTHNPMAPPFEFLCDSLLPLLTSCGGSIALRLERHGFYPRGGGIVVAFVTPLSRPAAALVLLERGPLIKGPELSIVASRTSETLVALQVAHLSHKLPNAARPVLRVVDADGVGNAVLATLHYAAITDVIVAITDRAKPAAAVASASAIAVAILAHQSSIAPVSAELADQLIFPMAIMGGGTFRTLAPLSSHFTTNASILLQFFGPTTVTWRLVRDTAAVTSSGAGTAPTDIFVTVEASLQIGRQFGKHNSAIVPCVGETLV